MVDVTPLTDQELYDLEVAVRANVWEPTDANSTLWQKGAAA